MEDNRVSIGEFTMSTFVGEPVGTTFAADDPTYEIIDGVRVELPPMGIRETIVAAGLSRPLSAYVYVHRLGRVVTEGLFAMAPGALPQRRPDLAFVSYERWPRARRIDPTNSWAVVPDLAVEVVSPGNYANEIPERVAEYFSAGVRRVWVIYPTSRLVYIYESPRSVLIVGPGEHVVGDDVVPGFRFAVDEMFEDLGADDPAAAPRADQ